MLKNSPVISASPEVMGETPVFAGTRVPVQTLLDLSKRENQSTTFWMDFQL
ncbi:DUF433 domain-containing protein [Phormidesmis sp. 146-35]